MPYSDEELDRGMSKEQVVDWC